jgi:hypothetical protein
MDDALFLLAMIGTGLLVFWLIKNDSEDPDAGQKGLFAFKRGPADVGRAVETAPDKNVPRWRR